jgi:hypothetical protein
LRAIVPGIYEKDDSIDITECVLEHQPLHLAIVMPTPMRPGEKGPADFDLAGRLIIAVKARRSDDPSGRGFRREQSSPRVQRLLEEGVEAIGIGPSLVRVLLPDRWVGGNREELIVVGWRQRAEGHERTFKNWLTIKGHGRLV